MVKQKNILMILPEGSDCAEFCSVITRHNYTRLCASEEEGFGFLERNRDVISAIILDLRLARESDYAYVKKTCKDPRFASIPIIAVSAETPSDEDMLCLELGISDLITPPCPWQLFSRRIFNAIRAKDSATFYEIEDMLHKLPCNIFLKDGEGKYVFSTQYWWHLDKRGDPNWTIRGKTDMEIRKDKENAQKAFETDQKILATGEGAHYVIEENAEGVQEFLELTKEPVFDAEGNVSGIIALIVDVTERELLRRKLEEKS